MTLKELQEKRERIVADARERLADINNNTDEARTAELESQHDAAMAELDALDKQIERELTFQEVERRAASFEERAAAGDPRRPNNNGEGRAAEIGESEDQFTYDDAFEIAIRHGVSQMTPEQRSILAVGRDVVSGSESRALGVSSDAAGGYTVPEGFVSELDKALAIWGPMYDENVTRQIVTSSGNDLPWPGIDDTGQEADAKAENAAVKDDNSGDPDFTEETLRAYVRSTAVVRMSMELLEDSAFDMKGLLNNLFAERLGRRANRDLTTGTGNNQPQGIVTGSAQGKTAASQNAIAADELIGMLHSVDPAYRSSPKCRWQFNDSTLAAIRKLKDGQGNYLWQMGDVRVGEPNALLAHPYSINQAMDGIAAGKKPIIFGDHSRYVVRKVKGFTVLTLRERYAEKFQIGLIGFKRYDGRLLRPAAVKHMNMAA